jgi:hypothetical protein
MKKVINISAILLFLFFIIIYSCTKKDDISINDSAQNEIVFKDLSLKQNVSPNILENHFYLIERLGNNSERENVINEANKKLNAINELDLKQIKKFYLNNSEILLYSIPHKTDKNVKVIMLKYREISTFCFVNERQISNKLKEFKMSTIDNILVYSVQVDSNDRVGNFVTNYNAAFHNFSNQIHDLAILSGRQPELKASCCRKEESYSKCLDCTVNACSDSFLCVAALALAPAEMIVAIAASCIGAGPNASC